MNLRVSRTHITRTRSHVEEPVALACCCDFHLPISAVPRRVTGHVPDRILATNGSCDFRPDGMQAAQRVWEICFSAGHARDFLQNRRIAVLLEGVVDSDAIN